MADLNKFVILFASLLLFGCQSNKDDLSAYIENVKQQPKPEVEPLPVMKSYEKFAYSAGELRNPFTQTVIDILPVEEEIIEEEVVDNGIRPDQNRLKEELEYYGLNELQLVGTLQQENIWALIRVPEGIIHRVKVGDYMGLNDGQILSVSDTEVTLKEIVPDEKGGFVERDSALFVVDVN